MSTQKTIAQGISGRGTLSRWSKRGEIPHDRAQLWTENRDENRSVQSTMRIWITAGEKDRRLQDGIIGWDSDLDNSEDHEYTEQD